MVMADDSKQSAPRFTSEQFYGLLRSQIEHEDNLLGTRVNWFVAAQSFLFTAYAIVVSNLTGNKTPWVNSQQRLLFTLIPLVAIYVCVLIEFGAVAAIFAMRRL